MTTGWMIRVRFPADTDFSLSHHIQTDSGAHPAPYAVGIEGIYPGTKPIGVKQTACFHLLPRIRMRGALRPLSHMSS